MGAIYCFRVLAEGARKNRGSQCLLGQKPIFAHRKPKTKTREPGCQNVWTSRKKIRATLIEGPRNVWSVSKNSRCSFRWEAAFRLGCDVENLSLLIKWFDPDKIADKKYNIYVIFLHHFSGVVLLQHLIIFSDFFFVDSSI